MCQQGSPLEETSCQVWVIKQVSSCSKCCSVDVNHTLTDWFDVNNGVKQGCILSPTLFAMFIDDLVAELKVKQSGVNCQTCMLSCLLYADDIVLLAPFSQEPPGSKKCSGRMVYEMEYALES